MFGFDHPKQSRMTKSIEFDKKSDYHQRLDRNQKTNERTNSPYFKGYAGEIRDESVME